MGEIDANGILNVSAAEKSTGKAVNLQVDRNKEGLSSDEVERMVAEAEQFKADDEQARKRVDARNACENYAFSLKNAVNEDKISANLDQADKDAVLGAIDKTTSWLDNNPDREAEEYEAACRRAGPRAPST